MLYNAPPAYSYFFLSPCYLYVQVKYAELIGQREATRRTGDKSKNKDKDCIIA